jgi:hypothetical protein
VMLLVMRDSSASYHRMWQRTAVREGESHATNDRTGVRAGPPRRQEPKRSGRARTPTLGEMPRATSPPRSSVVSK